MLRRTLPKRPRKRTRRRHNNIQSAETPQRPRNKTLADEVVFFSWRQSTARRTVVEPLGLKFYHVVVALNMEDGPNREPLAEGAILSSGDVPALPPNGKYLLCDLHGGGRQWCQRRSGASVAKDYA